jgi:hypothetical protein
MKNRKNKKIRDPEKWEEEQLKRKERHVKHLRDGLIQEWIIPVSHNKKIP